MNTDPRVHVLLAVFSTETDHSPGPRHFCLTGVPYLDSTLWLGPSPTLLPGPITTPLLALALPLDQPYPYKVTKLSSSGHSSPEPLQTHGGLGPAQSSKPSSDNFGLAQPTSPPRHSHHTLSPFPSLWLSLCPAPCTPLPGALATPPEVGMPLAPPHTSTSCSHQAP